MLEIHDIRKILFRLSYCWILREIIIFLEAFFQTFFNSSYDSKLYNRPKIFQKKIFLFLKIFVSDNKMVSFLLT